MGVIPIAIGNLGNLQCLLLSYNSVARVIPSTIENFQSLKYLSFHSSKLNGPIPYSLHKLKSL